jgi:hypothetical protein
VVKTKEFISGKRDREGERSENNFLTAGEAAENCITKRFVIFTFYQGGNEAKGNDRRDWKCRNI